MWNKRFQKLDVSQHRTVIAERQEASKVGSVNVSIYCPEGAPELWFRKVQLMVPCNQNLWRKSAELEKLGRLEFSNQSTREELTRTAEGSIGALSCGQISAWMGGNSPRLRKEPLGRSNICIHINEWKLTVCEYSSWLVRFKDYSDFRKKILRECPF